jgi:hypothetical protein
MKTTGEKTMTGLKRRPKTGDMRYVASWLVSFGEQKDPDNFNPDACVYKQQVCLNRKHAATVAMKNDMHGEGTVITEECWFDIVPHWSTVTRESAIDI